jgi:thioredoxin 2
MNGESVIVPCPQCGAKNRIPKERLREQAVCGKCRTPLSLARLFPDRAVDIRDGTFSEEILHFPGPVVLEFHAPWCGYCRMLSPILDQLAAQYAGRVKIAKMNVDENPITASQYGIRSTPSLFFFKNGKVADQLLGAVAKAEIERHILAIL